jgi:hypothetical protein
MHRRLRIVLVVATAVSTALTIGIPAASARRRYFEGGAFTASRDARSSLRDGTTPTSTSSAVTSARVTTTTRRSRRGGPVPPSTTAPTTTAPTTTAPTTTVATTIPTTPPASPPVGVSSSPPAAGGYFTTLAPGAALPSDATCASEVHASTWEPRPENSVANNTMGPATNTLGNFSQWNATWNSVDKPRIDGHFTGTTDEIIQWAACKWGLSDDVLRAQAVDESNWRQATTGDVEPRSKGHCVFDDTGSSCPTSFSIIQVKWYYHPAGFASGTPQSSYPWIKTSTAFALDQEAAEMRGCYDGDSTYLGKTAGDLWGCIQDWYSGDWQPGGGAYANRVKGFLASKPWLTWAG